MPSGATISRARLYVDVGFMLLRQDYHDIIMASDPVLYGLVDSSPQGGRNWQLFEMHFIDGQHLKTCADAARALLSHTVNGAEDCAEHERLRSLVAGFIEHHIFPPTALGTRRSSLAMKLHACVHSLRLGNLDWGRVS